MLLRAVPNSVHLATIQDDNLLSDLPPMDGDDDDGDPIDSFDADQLTPFETVKSGEDDGHAFAALPVGELIDELRDAPDTLLDATQKGDAYAGQDGDAEPPATAIETGDVEFDFDDRLRASDGDDEEGVAKEDLAVGIDALVELGDDDALEGTDEPLEDEIDESAFPELDADGQDESGQLDIGEIALPDDFPMPAWDSVIWERVETPLVALPLRSVSCHTTHVTAAGDGAVVLTRNDDGRWSSRYLPLEGREGVELIGIGLVDEACNHIVLASRQRLMLSADAGRTVRWVADVSGDGPGAGLRRIELGASNASFAYAVTSHGKLLVSADRGRAWRAMDGVGSVQGLTLDQNGTAHVFGSLEGQVHWLRSDEGGRWDAKQLDDDRLRVPAGETPRMSVRDDTWVLATRAGHLFISTNAGDAWRVVRLPQTLEGVAVMPDDAGPLIVGTFYVESEDRSYLFTLRPDGDPKVVADLSPDVDLDTSDVDPSEGMGRAHDVVWDSERSCVWLAGEFGLCAWRPKLPT